MTFILYNLIYEFDALLDSPSVWLAAENEDVFQSVYIFVCVFSAWNVDRKHFVLPQQFWLQGWNS